ncbi:hypothetical protein GCM10020229_53890 [Kitasatospora albolonga]
MVDHQQAEVHPDLAAGGGGQPGVGQDGAQHGGVGQVVRPVDRDPAEGQGGAGAVVGREVGLFQHLVEQGGGGAGVAQRDGLLGRLLHPGQPGLAVPGGQRVVGDLDQRRGRQGSQRLDGLAVQPGPLRSGHVTVRHLLGQHVPEDVLPAVPRPVPDPVRRGHVLPLRRLAPRPVTVPGLPQDGRLERLGQPLRAALRVEPGDGGEQLLAGGDGQHGGRVHHGGAGLGEGGQAFGDGFAQAPGHLGVGQVGGGLGRPAVQALLGQGDQVLLGDQRQALAALVEGGGQVGGGLPAEGGGGQFADRRLGERGEPDDGAAGAGRAPVGGAEDGGAGRQVLGPVGADQAEPLGQVAGEQQQELPGGLVDPVQVLDHQHGRADRGEERPYAVDELVPLGLGVAGPGRRGGQAVGEVGQQRGEGTGGGWDALGGEPAAALAQRVHHRAVGEGLAQRVAVAGEHPVALGGQGERGLVDQPGLPDPGLPLDQDHGGRVPHGRQQEPELPLTADELEAPAGGRSPGACCHAITFPVLATLDRRRSGGKRQGRPVRPSRTAGAEIQQARRSANPGVRPARWSAVVAAEAEGVAGRVEQHPDVGLWLVVRQGGAEGEGLGHRVLQVPHLEVEVHHRALRALARGPDRGPVAVRLLEDQEGALGRGGDHGGAGFLVAEVPAQQVDVEPCQRGGVGGLDRRAPPHALGA